MAKSVKYCLCKHQDLSSDLGTHAERQAQWLVLATPLQGDGDKWIPALAASQSS